MDQTLAETEFSINEKQKLFLDRAETEVKHKQSPTGIS